MTEQVMALAMAAVVFGVLTVVVYWICEPAALVTLTVCAGGAVAPIWYTNWTEALSTPRDAAAATVRFTGTVIDVVELAGVIVSVPL